MSKKLIIGIGASVALVAIGFYLYHSSQLKIKLISDKKEAIKKDSELYTKVVNEALRKGILVDDQLNIMARNLTKV